jgi:hypothetical protein
VIAEPGWSTAEKLSFTNTGPGPTTVKLSTRALTHKVYDSGLRQFTMDPGNPTSNMGTFPIWSGLTEVYQAQTFTVPASGASRLIFSADYQDTGQSNVLHFALYEPNGAYAGYSVPQGLADYGTVEVANPPAGKWTVLFFTAQTGTKKGVTGTQGPVQWDVSVWNYEKAGPINPSSLPLAAGQTATATLSVTTPLLAGDTEESVVVASADGETTIPVTVRTEISLGTRGGTFKGALTGGNGRAESEAETNSYFFSVPKGKTDLDASVALSTDPDEQLVSYLVSPDGQTVGYSSNYTFVLSGGSFSPKAPYSLSPGNTPYLQMYSASPEAGQWELVLQWLNPVTGNELTEPFSGSVQFNQVKVKSLGLPDSPSRKLPQDQAASFRIRVTNNGVAPEAYFIDPRLNQSAAITLKNIEFGTSASDLHLPLSPRSIPLYLVPPATTQVNATVTRVTGTGALSFDMSHIFGDPDIASGVSAPGVTSSSTASTASLSLSEPEVSQGLWELNPGEVGPYGASRAPAEVVSARVTAVTKPFDTTVSTQTDDLWQVGLQFARFAYLEPGQSVTLFVEITPTAAVGTQVSGTLYVDDFALDSIAQLGTVWPNSDVVAEVPYSYSVTAP